ncbi:MAG: class I SAM-dependent methyltransferase [Thalassobaculum sp.]|uniref:class I SAM-dependent methyltransferase n=1 Tax=Thalassobaculum sp. TaxID=2022740 RepID=UPI0032EDDA3A
MEDLALKEQSPTGSCRFCGSTRLSPVADLGAQVPANAFVAPDRVDRVEARYPLRTVVCHDCWLVELDHVVPPESIFRDYAYLSSYSPSWLRHAERFVDAAVARFGLGRDSLVLEIASNDGYLLQYVVARGIPALGIEPAENVAALARAKDIPTEVAFFDESTAASLRARGLSADLIVANNVLAHVPAPGSLVAGLPAVLSAEGVVSVEVPHLQRLLEGAEFDTIYHEHYSYFSLGFLQRLFRTHGLRVFDVEHLATHGGSLRVFACHQASRHVTQGSVAETVEAELAAGLETRETYDRFGEQVLRVRRDLLAFLEGARRGGKSVVGYGAAAKGNTLLNYCGLGVDDITYVVDMNPLKQNQMLPQSRIPVLAPERLAATKPDYVLILPWNLRDEIAESMSHVRDWGGRFVVAVPRLEVL